MKSKKLLAILLAGTMCISMFAACGKKTEKEETSNNKKEEIVETYHEDLIALLDEVGEIKKGESEIDVEVTISKDFLEMTEENIEESENSLSFQLNDSKESLEDLYDKDGNLKVDISAESKFNVDKEEYFINFDMLDNEFNLFVDESVVYLEIDGIVKLVKDLVGEEISELADMFSDYKYLMIDSEEMGEVSEDDEESEEAEEPKDIKSFANKDNVTKKDNVYTIRLENEDVNEFINAEELLEALDVEELEDSSFTLSVEKSKDDYNVDALINLENLIIIKVDATTTESSEKIKMPSKDDSITIEEIIALFMGGMNMPGVNIPEEDWDDVEFPEEDWGDVEFPEDDWNDVELPEDDWDDVESPEEVPTEDEEPNYDFQNKDTVKNIEITNKFNIGTGTLSFVTETKNYSVDEMDDVALEIAPKVKSAISDVTDGANINMNTSSSMGDYSYNMTIFAIENSNYNERVIVYMEEEGIDLTLAYENISTDSINNELAVISNKIKTLTGVDISEMTLKKYVDELINSYDGVDDMISARSSYDFREYDFTIYLWDGERLDIELTVKS